MHQNVGIFTVVFYILLTLKEKCTKFQGNENMMLSFRWFNLNENTIMSIQFLPIEPTDSS